MSAESAEMRNLKAEVLRLNDQMRVAFDIIIEMKHELTEMKAQRDIDVKDQRALDAAIAARLGCVISKPPRPRPKPRLAVDNTLAPPPPERGAS
jgi:hypothetical protein